MGDDVAATAVISLNLDTLRARLSEPSPQPKAQRIARWVLRVTDSMEVHVFAQRSQGNKAIASVPGDRPSPQVESQLQLQLEQQVTVSAGGGEPPVDAITSHEPRSAPRIHRLHDGPGGPLLGYLVTVGARNPLSDSTLEELGRLLTGALTER